MTRVRMPPRSYAPPKRAPYMVFQRQARLFAAKVWPSPRKHNQAPGSAGSSGRARCRPRAYRDVRCCL